MKPMDKASEAIMALKPVTFHYKSDKTGTPQFGLIAEEVAEVNPDLVVRDENGEIYTVRYDAVNAMLLNEFLKEHWAFVKEQRKVEAQEATITQLKQDFQSKLAEQQRQIKALTSGLEKVNNQLELNKPAPQMVSSNQ
jgi:septal ring factor EnvC (AmiA/AmiB activator)